MNSPSIHTGSGFGMFDALLVLSRNICLLIAGPLIVAALVVGALLALPARFTSHAMVLPKTPAVEVGLAPGLGGRLVFTNGVASYSSGRSLPFRLIKFF